ncbi:retrovirus-related pol polyprotein from transposon TNT 1-94 [Tanacetum coccineum]
MTLEIHNWSSSAHQEIHKIVKDEIFPIVNQVDARVQNFKIQFLKEAAKFVRDFQSLAKEADESLAKHKALELEIERLLRAVVSQDIMSIVQNPFVVDSSNLQTELESYNDMQQKIQRLQAQLGDQQGKIKDTLCVSNTLDPLSQKLENENVELEFQVRNYEKENAHLKTTYKNLFDSISVTRAQTKTIIDSFQNKLHDTMYENAKLRAQLFDKVSEQNDTTKGTSVNTLACLAVWNDKSKVVYAMCKQCLITANHDVCVLNYVNDMNSRGKKQKANVSYTDNQKKQKPEVKKPKKVGFKERLASPTPSEPSISHRNLIANGFQIPLLFLAGTVHFGNDHVAAILGYDLEVAFRRNTCFVRNLEGVDLLKGNRITNLYTINLHDMASASLIYLMASATSTKSWLWHQRLSHLKFDTINDLTRNKLITGLPKFKYHKEHLCPFCEEGKKQKGISPTQTSSKF